MTSNIRAVGSESSLGEFSITKDIKFLHADNEGSDQTDAQFDFSLRCAQMS